MSPSPHDTKGLRRYLPAIGSPAYHVMLATVAIFILGPLGGVSAAYMNFSLGFFIGGQVLAGILGSTVTLGYGPEGKHGANYMQTMAASVAGLSGMAVLVQAMVWLGLPEPPAWKLVLYFTCIGMFGAGVGMLYTPVLVDRMQLAFPSGYAVANILRALTDKNLLKRSIAKLGGGMLGGFGGGLAMVQWPKIGDWGINISTIGAGMIVGARITVPALALALVGVAVTPYLRSVGWIGPSEPFRNIGFIIALGMILGAAIVDLTLILVQFVQRIRQKAAPANAPTEDWKRVNTFRLVLWIVFWGGALTIVASSVLQQPMLFVLIALALVFVFVMINGISQGISDSNPISSAFVISIFVMALFGLKDPGVGLMCGAILLLACGVGVDMQQDRSTGWRLGTNRVNQFRYQVIGVLMGAVLAVVMAKVFMATYGELRVDQFANPDAPGTQRWQSAMTIKFVGALRSITNPKAHVMLALWLGISIGLVTEVVRKVVKSRRRYQEFVQQHPKGAASDFVFDALLAPSPYASSFGGFFTLLPVVWFGLGGILGSLLDLLQKARNQSGRSGDEVPADMSTTSLVGGGLIAGDSLAALAVGIAGLVKSLLGRP